MKNILIVSALPAELKEVKQAIKKLNFKWLKFSFFSSGMGNYNMIFALTTYLEEHKDIDFVVNIGVCGWSPHPSPLLWEERECNDFIQVWRIKNIANDRELIVPVFFEFEKIKSIACSEKIVYDERILWEENFVDMESYGFEFVCDKFNLPRIILKVPVDKIGEETKNFDFEKAKKVLRENIDYERLCVNIERFLNNKNKPHPSPLLWRRGDILEKISFTESQKIIFERLYNKYEVLVWDDFDEYLENFLKDFEEKKIEKRDVKRFLKELEEYLEDK